jgi:hypothetical protein
MAHDVFISYSSKDKPTADAACAVLESRGIRCWIAPRDVIPGKAWGASIIEALKGARVMVLIFSDNANKSQQIMLEVERAVSKGIIIIPVRIENIVPTESLELFLGARHWLDAYLPPLDNHLNRLAQVIQQILGIAPKEVFGDAEGRKAAPAKVEALETHVAVTADGKSGPFNLKRTTEGLVGSIFKGKVRSVEHGLKAAFVDIGLEKIAFIHYWDIVPNQFDSGIELVKREGRRPQKPKIKEEDIPRLYPPGSDIIVQVTKAPIASKGGRVTRNIVLPGRLVALLPNSDESGISLKIENPEERQRLKKILRELQIPEGMGVIMLPAGEGQQLPHFERDLALLIEEWNNVSERIRRQPMATCVFQKPDLNPK